LPRKKSNALKPSAANNAQQPLPTAPAVDEHLDISTLETWLWDTACAIRGATDAPKFKDFILPLVFFKRLSDVFDDEFEQHVQKFGSREVAHRIIEADHTSALTKGRAPIIRFIIPAEYNWQAIRHYPANSKLGEFVGRARGVTSKPVCVGFGIANAESARIVAELADGVIVGSALVARTGANGNAVEATRAFLAELRAVISTASNL
jgi:type I restriction enzyme M protein